MKIARIHFEDEGQDLEFLDVDPADGLILDVSPACSPTVANIYLGNKIHGPVTEDMHPRIHIIDLSNGGSMFTCRYRISSVEAIA